MLPRLLGLSFVLLVACGGDDTGEGGSGTTGTPSGTGVTGGGVDVESEMLAAHNAARAAVDPAAATAIPALEWSDDLAKVASDYAKECRFEHSEGEYGENLFATSLSARPAAVVKPWVDEKADFDYASNTCAAGKVCGHYTQVVWAKSLRVGCGYADCIENSPFDGSPSPRWQNWVCNYDPPGNYVGQKPY